MVSKNKLKNMKLLIVILFSCAVIFIFMYHKYHAEKRDYNNGICPHCKTKMKFVACDGVYRHYKCYECNYKTSVSFCDIDNYHYTY